MVVNGMKKYKLILVIFQGFLFTVNRGSRVQSLNFLPFFQHFLKSEKFFLDIFLVSWLGLYTNMQKSSKYSYRYNNNSAMSVLTDVRPNYYRSDPWSVRINFSTQHQKTNDKTKRPTTKKLFLELKMFMCAIW